jgi:hypothetical protein
MKFLSMENENQLRFTILKVVKKLGSLNTTQLEQNIIHYIPNYPKDYVNLFNKAVTYLRDNAYLNTIDTNTGIKITSISEKGESVLNFQNWEDFEESIHNKKLKEKKIQDIDIELKEKTLKNQKFLPYTSISGLVFGLGSMIWTILDKYDLIFINISFYFIILLIFTFIFIFIYIRK